MKRPASSSGPWWAAVCLAIVIAAQLPARTARAEADDLLVFRTPHFSFTYHPGSEGAVRSLAEGAEAVRDQVCREIRVRCFEGPVRVHLATSADEFRREQRGVSAKEGHLDWAAGIAYPRLGFVLLRTDRRVLLDLSEIFHHEVSHIAVRLGVDHRFLPRWFVEGLAIHQAGEPVLGRIQAASKAALTRSLIPIRDLSFRFPAGGPRVSLAYAESVLFLRWLLAEHAEQGHVEVVGRVARGQKFADAFQEVFGASADDLWEDWRDTFSERASWLPILFDAGLMWGLLSFLFLYVYWKKRRDMRATLDRWGKEEASRPPAWHD